MSLRRWRGDEVKRKYLNACIIGVNVTMAQSVEYAKGNHPWENRTTTLEKGIRIAQSATVKANRVTGLWGVVQVAYGKWLEKNPKWSWLRPTASIFHPRLVDNIKAALGNG